MVAPLWQYVGYWKILKQFFVHHNNIWQTLTRWFPIICEVVIMNSTWIKFPVQSFDIHLIASKYILLLKCFCIVQNCIEMPLHDVICLFQAIVTSLIGRSQNCLPVIARRFHFVVRTWVDIRLSNVDIKVYPYCSVYAS